MEEEIKENNLVEERKNKIKSFFTSNKNLLFWIILAIGVIIRLSQFFITKNQALWWDESDYLAYAKNLAGFNGGWIVTSKHISIFPYIVSIFFRLGFNEPLTKFFVILLPSILLIYLTYLACLQMYKDKRIALISAFVTATLWSLLFNTTRFHVGIPALIFGTLAIYTFFKGYERKEKIFGLNHKWAVPITVFLTILTYSIRRGYFLFGLFFLVYMLCSRSFKDLFKDKYNWIALGVAIVSLFLVEKVIFPVAITDVAGGYFHPEDALNWKHLQIFSQYFLNSFNNSTSTLLYLFYLGLILVVVNLFLHLGHIKKSNNPEVKSDLFLILTMVLTFSYFIFYQRGTTAGEPRWYFPILLACLVFVSKGAIFLGDWIKKYNKHLSILLIVVLIGFGGYYEYKMGSAVINNKVGSFAGIRDAGLYIKSIAGESDVVISVPRPQAAYYSERQVFAPYELIGVKTHAEATLEGFLAEVRKPERDNVKFIIVSFSEPNHPEWMIRRTATSIEIPFMNSTINLQTGQQDIKQTQTYEDITFNLIKISGDTLVYSITKTI